MRERLDYIDRTRGILIITVVIGHIWQAGYIHNLIYAFHMPAFFTISGILLSYTRSYEKNYRQFVLNRIYSFGIPFLFIEILGCCTDIIRHGVNINIKGYLYNTLTFNFNDSNLWFIVTLFLVEILFVFAKKIVNNSIVMWIFCLVLLFIYAISPMGNRYTNILLNVCKYFFFFMVGFYGRELLTVKNGLVMICSGMMVIVVAMIGGKLPGGHLSIKSLLLLLSGLCGSYLILQIGRVTFKGLIDLIILEAGKNTIIIYGTHHFIYSIVGVLMKITDYKTTPILVGIIMCLAVALAEVPIIYMINRWAPFLAGKPLKHRVCFRGKQNGIKRDT